MSVVCKVRYTYKHTVNERFLQADNLRQKEVNTWIKVRKYVPAWHGHFQQA